MSEFKLIQESPVVRDLDGYWSHPDMPFFEEGEDAEWKGWVDAQALELACDRLEDESDEHPAYIKYFEEDSADISDWHPERPRGEGWFTLSIHMTDDGAIWVWARKKGGAA